MGEVEQIFAATIDHTAQRLPRIGTLIAMRN